MQMRLSNLVLLLVVAAAAFITGTFYSSDASSKEGIPTAAVKRVPIGSTKGEQVIHTEIIRRYVRKSVSAGTDMEGWQNIVVFVVSPDGSDEYKYYYVPVTRTKGPQ